ncbi:MAG: hypothetical protein Q7R89_02165 [bacterium]|nr:hypothetical protein [bacterium]
MSNFIRKYWMIFFLIAFLSAFVLILVFITPEEIVDYVGVENTYVVSFLLAVFGGLSTVTGISFFASVVTFSSGGANPLFLGLFGGLGIFISDTIFFFVARYGIQIFKERVKPLSLWLVSKMKKVSLSIILVGVYIYIGFTPFPNDILMVALVFIGMPFKRLAPVLLTGSITIVMLTAYLGEIIFK